jgi:hypothetical protein
MTLFELLWTEAALLEPLVGVGPHGIIDMPQGSWIKIHQDCIIMSVSYQRTRMHWVTIYFDKRFGMAMKLFMERYFDTENIPVYDYAIKKQTRIVNVASITKREDILTDYGEIEISVRVSFDSESAPQAENYSEYFFDQFRRLESQVRLEGATWTTT